MARVREVFAENLRKNRLKCGLSQEKLAERTGISTHYVTMIELSKNFPKSEIIERLANALNIEVHELFIVSRTPVDELEKLHRVIASDIKQIIAESIENAFNKGVIKKP